MIRKTMSAMIALGLAAGLTLATPASAETTLSHIKQSGAIKLGYRESSPPFSFVGDDKQPRGYSIDLCRLVADNIARQLGLAKLDVKWVMVSAKTRFEALKSGDIDLECGNTTQTLSRRADFDFSLMTYVDGAGLLFRKGGIPKGTDHLTGQRIAVVAGTTTEQALAQLGAAAKLGATLVRVPDHNAGLKALIDKQADAYAADRTVLVTTALIGGQGTDFELSPVQFTYEPYGLMMRPDHAFRLAVDRSLAHLYRTGEVSIILQRWFGQLGNPGEVLKVMFLLNGLPE